MAQPDLVTEVKRGRLVSQQGQWYIKNQDGTLTPLPPGLEPRKIRHKGDGLVRFRSGVSKEERSERRHGLKVLHQDNETGQKVVLWGACPNRLRDERRFPTIMVVAASNETFQSLRTRKNRFQSRMVG